MNIRRETTVQTYDFWLDVYGASRRARRDLRRELRANLEAAEADGGWARARAGLGDLRAMARQDAEATKPAGRLLDWRTGLGAALAAMVAVWVVGLLLATVFIDGASAASPGSTHVEAPMSLVPGSRVTFVDDGHRLEMGLYISPWTLLVPAALALAAGLRPWRLMSRTAAR